MAGETVDLPHEDVDLTPLGYTAQVGGKPQYVRIRRTVPWGISKKLAREAGEDAAKNLRTDAVDQLARRLILEWNLTPRSQGVEAEMGPDLGVDLSNGAMDKVPPIPKDDPVWLAIVGTDVVTALITRYNDINKPTEGEKDFSKTSSIT